jgi:hypothetical protein
MLGEAKGFVEKGGDGYGWIYKLRPEAMKSLILGEKSLKMVSKYWA